MSEPGEAVGGWSPGRISRAEAREVKKRGIVLASTGLLLALVALAYFRLAGLTEASWAALGALAGATLLVQSCLWLVPHRGWDRHLDWDDDYVIVPLLAAAFLLLSYAAVVPEARHLLLVGWFAALLFGLRFLGFAHVVGFGVLVTALYVAVLLLHLDHAARHDFTWRVEGGQVAVLFALHVFAAGIFERVRREREEKMELRTRLAEESITDPLTGVRNRRYLERFLETEVARAERYGAECSLAMLDLDHFKNYNDAHGHPAGDRVLQVVAGILRSEAREADVPVRYGGEEFAVVMPDTGLDEGVTAADRVRGAVEGRDVPGEEVMPDGLTVSLGVASFPDHADSAGGLIRAADRALYEAKERGRNRVVAAGERVEDETV